MIPKKIHYCWFGETKIPEVYQSYIEEWVKLHPDWELIKWDETNSPMDLAYMKTAQAAGKWANMSNLIRFYAVLKSGGVYLDTDVKVIKPLDPLLNNESFFGFESGNNNSTEFWVNNAVFGAVENQDFIQKCYTHILEHFDGLENANASAPQMVTDLLKKEKQLTTYGLQQLKDVQLYPVDFFYPIDYNDSFKLSDYKKHITPNTFAVHMWGRSWMSKEMLLGFIDDLQRIVHTYKLQIEQLNSQLIEMEKEKESIKEQLKKSDHTNHSHVYDKGLLDQEINNLKEKLKNENQLNINHTFDKKGLTEEIESLEKKARAANALIDIKETELASLNKKMDFISDDFSEKEKIYKNQLQLLKASIETVANANKLIEAEYQTKIKQITESNEAILKIKDSVIVETQKLVEIKNNIISDLETLKFGSK